MRKKKEHDFPEINYTFMNKSTYRTKNQKYQRIMKLILSIIIIFVFVYVVFYVLVISKNPNFFEELTKIKKESNSSSSPIEMKDNKSSVEEKTLLPPDDPESSPLSHHPDKETMSTAEKISLQMSLYGLQDEKEIQAKKAEYLQRTGENFETSFLFPSDIEVIPDDILLSSSREQAAVLRNEIFARHGYPFESGRLLNYFSLKKWYQKSDKQIELSELEKTNVNKILQFEISKGWKKK